MKDRFKGARGSSHPPSSTKQHAEEIAKLKQSASNRLLSELGDQKRQEFKKLIGEPFDFSELVKDRNGKLIRKGKDH